MSGVIWCFVIGGLNTFPVNFDQTMTVGHLKRIIIDAMAPAPGTIPIYDLLVYRVEIETSDQPHRISRLNQLAKTLNLGDALDVERQLSEIWSPGAPGKSCYMIVQPPKGESMDCGGVVLMADMWTLVIDHGGLARKKVCGGIRISCSC
jgi:hypothetical protein